MGYPVDGDPAVKPLPLAARMMVVASLACSSWLVVIAAARQVLV